MGRSGTLQRVKPLDRLGGYMSAGQHAEYDLVVFRSGDWDYGLNGRRIWHDLADHVNAISAYADGTLRPVSG